MKLYESITKNLKEATNLNDSINKVAQFLKNAVEGLKQSDAANDAGGCYHLNLSPEFALYVGWSSGFDENDPDYIHSVQQPEYCIDAGVKIRNDFDCADFEYLDFPWGKDGDVWDNGLAMHANMTDADYREDAEWFIEQYKEIQKAYNNGEVLIESENLKEAGAGSNKYVNAYMALSEATFDGMGDSDGWFSFAETLADEYGIKYDGSGFDSVWDAIKVVKKGMAMMYEQNPNEFKSYVESLILDSCINDGYFDYLDSKSHKDKEIVKSLQILLEYLQNNGGSQEAIDGIANELNDLANVQVNARQVGEEFCKYMNDNSFWKIMGTNCSYWTNKDLEGLPNDYACFAGDYFNFLLYDKWRKTGDKAAGLGYGFKNSNNGVIADLLTFEYVESKETSNVIYHGNFASRGKSFEITPENKESTFAKMKRAFIETANELKKEHLESYEDFIKSWKYEDTEERRAYYEKNLRDMGIKESQTQEIDAVLKTLKEKNPNIEKYLNEYYKVIADTEPRPAYDKDNDRMDPAWENWNKTTNNVLYSREAWDNFAKWVKDKYGEDINSNLNESDAYDTNEEARPTPAVDRSGEPYNDGSRIDPRTGERFFGKTVAEEYQAEVDKCLDAYNNKDLDTAYKAWCQLHEILDKRLDSAGPKDDDRFPLYKEWQTYIDKIPSDIMYEITDYGKNKIYAEEYGLKEAEGSRLLGGRYRTMSELRDLFKEYADHFETKGNRIKGNTPEDSYNRGWELGKADAYKLAAFEIENNVDPSLLGEAEDSNMNTTSLYIDIDELAKYAELYLQEKLGYAKVFKEPGKQYTYMLAIRRDDDSVDKWVKLHDGLFNESEILNEGNYGSAFVAEVLYDGSVGTCRGFGHTAEEAKENAFKLFKQVYPDYVDNAVYKIMKDDLNKNEGRLPNEAEWERLAERAYTDEEAFNAVNSWYGINVFDLSSGATNEAGNTLKESEEIETEEPAKQLWVYVSKHGLGPGTIPNDVEAQYVTSLPGTGKDIFSVSRELTPEELNKYELSLFDNKYFAKYPEVVKELFSLNND